MSSAFRGDSVVAIVGWKWLSQHTFSSLLLNFSTRLKVALPHFPRRSSLCVAFFFFRRLHWWPANMTSDPGVMACVGNQSGFEARSSPNWRNTHATPIWGYADEERGGKKGSEVVSFQAWYENLHRFYLSLLVEVPSEAWIFCKTLLTTTGHRSELKLSSVRPGTQKAPKRPETYMQHNICWAAGVLAGPVWCRQVTPAAAGWPTDVGRDSPWVNGTAFKC